MGPVFSLSSDAVLEGGFVIVGGILLSTLEHLQVAITLHVPATVLALLQFGGDLSNMVWAFLSFFGTGGVRAE